MALEWLLPKRQQKAMNRQARRNGQGTFVDNDILLRLIGDRLAQSKQEGQDLVRELEGQRRRGQQGEGGRGERRGSGDL